MKLVRCKRMIPNIMKMVVPNQLYCNFGTYDSEHDENDDSEPTKLNKDQNIGCEQEK